MCIPSDLRSFHAGTFIERVLIYDGYYLNTSNPTPLESRPVFFIPGGESFVEGGYEHNGAMFELGGPLGALVIAPEHRWYGHTFPCNVSTAEGIKECYSADMLQYFTIQQALEDYVDIIARVRSTYNVSDTAPLVTFGGSYPGELAFYLRQAYPEVVDASWAASAPLRVHPGMPDESAPGSFFEVATNDFGSVSPSCPKYTTAALQYIVEQYANGTEGVDNVATILNLCSPVDDLRTLNLFIENAFADMSMEDYPYAIPPSPALPMDAACTAMLGAVNSSSLSDAGAIALAGLGAAIEVSYNPAGSYQCLNVSALYYTCADITGCGGGFGDPNAMSWDYQSCTQIVSNCDTNGVTDMFLPYPFNQTEYWAYCQTTWGVTPQPLETSELYPYANASRVFFSNGDRDGWYPGGVLENIYGYGDYYPILIHNSAHHQDLRGSDPADSDSVVAARLLADQLITKWLSMAEKERRARK
eukprot:TRINITY_DN3946_c0_g1_i2.p1 TRINITY_DN3946_c0_g1~~TRINITY_DN3946_c0_g1_i2.p1  ORF type:complete len:473 (-),score=90.89 TRINITY_DN3946_c0_g1_i2:44-1462(-)